MIYIVMQSEMATFFVICDVDYIPTKYMGSIWIKQILTLFLQENRCLWVNYIYAKQ